MEKKPGAGISQISKTCFVFLTLNMAASGVARTIYIHTGIIKYQIKPITEAVAK